MVDFQSQYRIYSLGYTYPFPREPIPTAREVKHDANRLLYRKTGDRPVHDCRPEFAQEMREKLDWEGKVLARAMRDTYSNIDSLHQKLRLAKDERKSDIKMLIQIGQQGTRNSDFKYPRGVTCTSSGDIVVADSQNHRVQIFNRMGLFKTKFGSKGSESWQFSEPVDVSELPDNNIAVADKLNKRIQVYSKDGRFLETLPTVNEPCSLACDRFDNLFVATTARTIEVYKYPSSKILNTIKLGAKSAKCPVQIATNNKKQVVVSDPVDSLIKFYNRKGKLVFKFQPMAIGEHLAVVPGGIYVTVLGEVLVSDNLNHTVNMYTETGILIKRIISPTDETGNIHSITVGPEGHMVATEFNVQGEHTVKIYRCMACECHAVRPPSRRKRLSRLHFMDV